MHTLNGAVRAPRKPTPDKIETAVAGVALCVKNTLDQLSRDIGISPETAEQITALVIADVRTKTIPDEQLSLRLGGRK